MTKKTLTPAPQSTVVSSAADLAELWRALMGDGGFGRRTLWLGVLDASGRTTPVLVPIDDIPRRPSESDAAGLRRILSDIAGYGTVVMLLSRPGSDTLQDDDRCWGQALTPLAPGWPIHLATAGAAGSCLIQVIGA
jgi:hypothetical protein